MEIQYSKMKDRPFRYFLYQNGRSYMVRVTGFLFCGKATPVATVPRTVAKSRLSNPVTKRKQKKKPKTTGVIFDFLVRVTGFEPTDIPLRGYVLTAEDGIEEAVGSTLLKIKIAEPQKRSCYFGPSDGI